MQPGEEHIFKKSGNEVMLQELVPNSVPRSWVVVRTKGVSAGKQIINSVLLNAPVFLLHFP